MPRPILPPMRKRACALLLLPALVAGLLALLLPSASAQQSAQAAQAVQKMRCFGAPSRDIVDPCRNRALDTKVFPTPDDALLYPNSACEPNYQAVPVECRFGVPLEEAKGTVALIGDSHATHWRSAVQTVAEGYGWHGVSMTRTGCTYSTAKPVLPGTLTEECLQWRKDVYAWFVAHPEVRTVFISQHPGEVEVPPGKTAQGTSVRGFRDAWKGLPDTVKHIVIIRDTPWVGIRTPECIERAMRRKENAGVACAIPREEALRTDHAATAVERFRSQIPGLKLIEMTRYFCDDARCYPVVGGALTHKDAGHITLVFGETLGPYLLRKVRALGIKI